LIALAILQLNIDSFIALKKPKASFVLIDKSDQFEVGLIAIARSLLTRPGAIVLLCITIPDASGTYQGDVSEPLAARAGGISLSDCLRLEIS
jgi:hypothetical protein